MLCPYTGLPGVEVCAETTLVVTNSPQNFVWYGYGLQLNIQEGSLPEGMDQCIIYIKASIAGLYEFPERRHLVSPIFWLHCEPSCRFALPISMEIDHCAKPENVSKLSCVKALCSQQELPRTFRQLCANGCFNNFCGVLKLSSFSGVGVTQEGSEDREYAARLFYLSQTNSTYDLRLVVTWNDETHLTVSGSYLVKCFSDVLKVCFESHQCNRSA